MTARNLTVYYMTRPPEGEGDERLSLLQLRDLLYSGAFLARLWRYRHSQLLVDRMASIPRPSVTATALRLLARGRCRFADEQGQVEEITYLGLLPRLFELIHDGLALSSTVRRVSKVVRRRLTRAREERPLARNVLLHHPGLYVYALPDVGMRAGGSVGHIAGVLNNLDAFTGPSIFLTTAAIPTVRTDVERHLIPPQSRFRNFPAVQMLAATEHTLTRARAVLAGRPLSFVYQRYSLYDFTGVILAGRHQVPLVIEYNGSEVWVGKHWGQRLEYEPLANEIELLNLHAAEVIVVVSNPLRDELTARGIPPDKILVNPNGVDPDRYSDAIDGAPVRAKYGLLDKTVIGFIGTFGPWHGAEVLADAFGRLLAAEPSYRDRVRLLLIGDGARMPQVKAHLARHHAAHLAVLTGLVPQADGPVHLAACDVLASPHVPNADGTPFFGSPTKLFEYMATGKGIVASDLDQIGEVLDHGRTAWMVRPGDPDDLAAGLRALIEAPELRQRLGAAARAEAVAKYTWKEHTRRIIDKLKERCPPAVPHGDPQ